MSLEFMGNYREIQSIYNDCKNCMSYHVVVEMKDGSIIDGIIDEVDPNNVVILVGEDLIENEPPNQMNRQQNWGYGPRRRFRRFRRNRFPLGNINKLSLLGYPYFVPPYPSVYYPYFPY